MIRRTFLASAAALVAGFRWIRRPAPAPATPRRPAPIHPAVYLAGGQVARELGVAAPATRAELEREVDALAGQLAGTSAPVRGWELAALTLTDPTLAVLVADRLAVGLAAG